MIDVVRGGAFMRRSTILLSTAAVLVLSAGMVVGRLSGRIAVNHGHGWFAEQLNLSADQQKKMDAIWADAKQQVDKMSDRRHLLDKERDDAIRQLLTAEQMSAYDGVFEVYHAKRAEYDKDREKLFHDAEEESRKILTADQQVKLDAMKKDMRDMDHHGPGGQPGHPHGGPATQPHGEVL